MLGLKPGSVYADLSTGSPTRVRKVAERIEAIGSHMLDAPVSGGTIGAEAGTLAVMVGGDEDVFEATRSVFEAIGQGVSYVGPIGSGTVAKLVHNSISLTTRIVVQEGMTTRFCINLNLHDCFVAVESRDVLERRDLRLWQQTTGYSAARTTRLAT